MSPFRLVYIAFPSPADVIGGVTRYDVQKDQYLVAININGADDDQIRTLKHELSHILLGHFEDDRTENDQTYLRNIRDIEKEADDYADQMTEDEFSDLMTYQIGETVIV